jgi:heme-degrading monooxygenase HmoA
MFCAVYSFKVLEGKEQDFIESWKELTELIYKYEGSLGSRLHQSTANEYIAYAQWKSREDWKNSGGKLPVEADLVRAKMRNSCSEISTIHELEMVEELLRSIPFNKD